MRYRSACLAKHFSQLAFSYATLAQFETIALRPKAGECVPLRLIFGKDLALRVIADVANVHIAPDIELLRTEHGHDGGGGKLDCCTQAEEG